jgi:hypothetical protein
MAKKQSKRGGAREGAGRPISEHGPAILVTASVPKSLMDELEAVAQSEGWGRSRAIQEAIRAFVKRKKR